MSLIGPVIFYNNSCSGVIYVNRGVLLFLNYIEFSDNKGNTIIKYWSTNLYYLILWESTLLNVSHNSFKHFAYTKLILPTTPQCYFQYFSNRQLDNVHGNYSIIFEKNNEKYSQNAYVTCSAKTVPFGTFGILKNTILKHGSHCSSLALCFSHARFTV